MTLVDGSKTYMTDHLTCVRCIADKNVNCINGEFDQSECCAYREGSHS